MWEAGLGYAVAPAAVPLKSHPDALACVEQSENISRLVPLGILAVMVGLPVIAALLHLRLGAAILNGVIMFVVAGFVIRVVNKLILSPIRSRRYKAIAGKLASAMQAVPTPISQWRSWWAGAPGALTVTQRGELVLVDRSTSYEELWLHPKQISNVSVEREATQITNTRHGGRFALGGVSSSGFFGGYTFGGRSRSVTQTVETAFLEIHYQLERNGMTYTTVIPFGADRRGADALCATITRLEHQSS